MADLQIDNLKSVPTLQSIIDDLSPMLSCGDLRVFNILRNRYDNDNLLSLLKDKQAEINPLGTLTREDWLDIIRIIEESNELNPAKDKRILPYILEFYKYFKQEESKIVFPQEHLSALYYLMDRESVLMPLQSQLKSVDGKILQKIFLKH